MKSRLLIMSLSPFYFVIYVQYFWKTPSLFISITLAIFWTCNNLYFEFHIL